MAGSVAFARIKREVIELTLSIPPGRVAAHSDIAAVIDVMPRHVAYILATLKPEEEEMVPWYRAVSATGRLLPRQIERQAELLRAEGVQVSGENQVADWERRRFRFKSR